MDTGVIVVGAGLGWLTLAPALQRAEVPYLGVERAPELGEVGAGLGLWSRCRLDRPPGQLRP